MLAGLVKAGYKETSLKYYKIDKNNRLSRNKLSEAYSKPKVWTGNAFGYRWVYSLDEDRNISYYFYSGDDLLFEDKARKWWITEDMVCFQFEKQYDGLKFCGDIYINPEGEYNSLSEYIGINDTGLFPFSFIK